MKILIVSDTVSPALYENFKYENFQEVRLVISCGDLPRWYLEFLTTMLRVPCLYVPGNHDGDYLHDPPQGCISLDNRIVEIESLRIMGLGGSFRYNPGPYQYTEQQMRWRYWKLLPRLWWNRNRVDIFVAHSPAFELGDGDDLAHRGFKIFRYILHKYHPSHFFHGHAHLNYGMGSRQATFEQTKIVNSYQHYVVEVNPRGLAPALPSQSPSL